jgi:D-alanine-D-alanine ligase
MKVGITYDLRADYLSQGYSEEETAEFEGIETIDAIDDVLRRLGYQTDRIGNVHNLIARLAAGERWDLVFNIAEGMHGYGREAQVPALLDAFRIPYTFSDPLVLTLALHKATAKQLVKSMGFPTADFTIVNNESELDTVHLPWPVFVKPVASGSSIGVSGSSKAEDKSELAKVCRDLIGRFQQPVLVERFLPGREFTVGVVGTGDRARSFGVMEIHLRENAEPTVYSFSNKQNYKTRVSYRLGQDDVALKAEQWGLCIWTGLGCRDAGRVDLRCDAAGEPNFLEINPLAGLHPVDSDLVIMGGLRGMSHSDLIESIVASACERLPGRAKKSTGAA